MDSDEFDEDTLNQIFELTEAAAKNLSNEESKEITPSPQHLEVLSKYFGHNSFRPLQWEIISAVIKDKRDVCAVMCTGYGKSICFQYPSTFLGGITLVISPLISLMEDQILSLQFYNLRLQPADSLLVLAPNLNIQVSNITACLLGSAQRNQSHVIDEIFKNVYRVVYLTPEFCGGEMGRELLLKMGEKLKINLIAIDEAHCISSWGHDFRQQYRQLGYLRTVMPQVPIMAVTATATCRVRQDIVENLHLRNPLMVVSSFNRSNLYFQVYPKSKAIFKDLTKVMTYTNSGWKFSGPTIIYCITRKQTEEVTEALQVSGIKCRSYHAGLSLTKREEVHEQFIKDKVDVIVATIAFGMGIDKPDVRNVVHYGAFKSIESYYQEAGRAGRDGLPSICSVFFNSADFSTIRYIQETGSSKKINLKIVEEYLITRECRRRFLLSYFEEKLDSDKPQISCCDNCTKKLSDSRSDQEKYEGVDESGRYDFTKDARLFLEVVDLLKSGIGLTTCIMFLRGSNSKKIPDKYKQHKLYGAGRNSSEEWWKALGKLLIHEKYLDEQSRKSKQGFSYVIILLSSKGKNVLGSSDSKIMLALPSSLLHLLKKKPQKQSVVDSSQLLGSNNVSRSEWLNAKPNMQPGPSLSLKIDTEIEDKEKMDLYKKLLDGRADLSTKHDCMPYIIASNTALMKMAQCKPITREELRHLNLDGFTEGKILKFGDKFLKIINGIPEEDTSEKKPMKNILIKSEDASAKRLDALLSYADQIKQEEDSDATDIEDGPPMKKEKTEVETDESPQKTDFDMILDSPLQSNSNTVVISKSNNGSNMVTNKGPVDEVSKSPKTNMSKKSKKNLPPWLTSKKIV